MFDFIAQAAEPVITGLDVVKTVDAFYHNAWLMLVGMLFLFGIVMPLIIQRIQSSSFDKTEKRLKDEIEQIKNKTLESIQEEVKALKSTFVEIQKNMEKRIVYETRVNRAEFYSQLATSFSLVLGQEFNTFVCRIISAIEYATLKNYDFVTKQLNRIISAKRRIRVTPGKDKTETEELVEKYRTKVTEQVDKLSKILEEQGVITNYSEQLAKVYDFCKNDVVIDKPGPPPEEPKQERA